MAVLYRKYRPKTFAQVIGQKPIVRTLRNAVVQNKVAHAYIFTGSRGVGKTSLARIFARTLNCQNSTEGEACTTCNVCLTFDSNSFLDLIEVDAASNTGVDNVRELIEQVRFNPSLGKYKVFIIDEVHMLSKGAFNALLKTLEEPPEYVVFILATTEIHKVPATILSRAQRFDFTRFTNTEILEHLRSVAKAEKVKIDDTVLQLVVRHSGGGMRDALSLLDKLFSMGGVITLQDAQSLLGVVDIEHCRTLLSLIVAGDLSQLPVRFDTWSTEGVDFNAFNKDFLEYLRYVLVAGLAGKPALVEATPEDVEHFLADANLCKIPDLLYIIRLFLRAFKDQTQSLSLELPMLLAACEAALKFAKVAPVHGPTATVSQISDVPVATSSAPTESVVAVPHPTKTQSAISAEVVVEPMITALGSFTVEQVKDAWMGVCDQVKIANSPLATLLKNSPPSKVVEGMIYVQVRYLFHKENLESTKNQLIITEAITKVLGAPGTVRAEIVKSAPRETLSDMTAAAQDALRVFGGELVE